ncbi:other/FunK1 protein kinase [Coprinopsis cinerea AmutBmut pab1-1]|nr:other/FunK1 protein kinase [Coprinopsis cinerea AmutBmut pab1-1]
MVSYQEYDKLRTFRGGAVDDIENFPDRIQVHIILEEYGPSFDNFTSKRELLCAFVDAINGHLHSYKLGILHRDVSVHNILLGQAGSPMGWRGVLIDLDMAIWHNDPDRQKTSVDFRAGTRMFQSVMVLLGFRMDNSPPHDHLDDLESFFYVFTYILFAYVKPKERRNSLPRLLLKWDQSEPERAEEAKCHFMALRLHEVTDTIDSWWGNIVVDLFTKFKQYIRNRSDDKRDAWYSASTPDAEAIKKLRDEFEDHYKHITKLFQDAITNLDKVEADEAASKAAIAEEEASSALPPSPSPQNNRPSRLLIPPVRSHNSNSSDNGKRKLEEGDGGEIEPPSPLMKRLKDLDGRGVSSKPGC